MEGTGYSFVELLNKSVGGWEMMQVHIRIDCCETPKLSFE